MRAAITSCLVIAAAVGCATPTSSPTPPSTSASTGTGGSNDGNVADKAGASAAPSNSNSLDPFYDPLVPYGDWWWSDRWGWVWSPSVAMGWRPYSVGHWSFTNEGWFWASDEPFGWATYHYGRWAWVDDAGWVWIPGRVYAPSWVVWRTAPGYFGWAQLGPLGVEADPFGYVFVEDDMFLAPSIATVCVPVSRNAAVLPSTHVLHRPPQRTSVEHAIGRRVPIHRVVTDERMATSKRDIVVRRVPGGAVRARSGGAAADDIPGKKGQLTQGDNVTDRPITQRDDDNDDDINRRFADQKRRARDDDEARQIEAERVREMRAAHGRRSLPRRVPVATPRRR